MPETREITVYQFDELSDKAKEKVREWYRTGQLDCDWWDSVYENADTIASTIGIDIDREDKNTPAIYFSGFWSQGDGACFEGSYRYKKGWRKELQAYAPKNEHNTEIWRIAEALQAVQARQFYKLEATCRQRGHYQHSGCMSVEVAHADCMYRDIGDVEDEITTLLRDFADWIYAQLETENDWLTADEQVDEAIRANEYEFLENGSLA